MNITYVYPNVSELNRGGRGGLLERWQLAIDAGCGYIEVPADFVKNETEVKITGLDLGSFLTEDAIGILYKNDHNLPEGVKYILHTEPRTSNRAPLKWHDRRWVKKFVGMVINISNFFGMPAAAIEIHPGNRKNSYRNITTSIITLLDEYNKEFKVKPLILIENRTGQSISSGTDILYFWKFLSESYPHLQENVGIVLDIQQLYTVTKKNFLIELEMIPLKALKGFHIHYKHGVPDISNEIPWQEVFSKIINVKNDMIINPEIHHKNKVKDAIKFCEDMSHA